MQPSLPPPDIWSLDFCSDLTLIGSSLLSKLRHCPPGPLCAAQPHWPLCMVAQRPCSAHVNTFQKALPCSAGEFIKHSKSHSVVETPLTLQSDLSSNLKPTTPGKIVYVLWASVSSSVKWRFHPQVVVWLRNTTQEELSTTWKSLLFKDRTDLSAQHKKPSCPLTWQGFHLFIIGPLYCHYMYVQLWSYGYHLHFKNWSVLKFD